MQKFWYTIHQPDADHHQHLAARLHLDHAGFPARLDDDRWRPIYSTEMLSTFTYKLAFAQYEFSLASASAIIILLISMSVTYFYIKHQQRR